MLYVKHNEKAGSDRDKLKRQYNTLDDSEKLIWIQKAITAYEVSEMQTNFLSMKSNQHHQIAMKNLLKTSPKCDRFWSWSSVW